MCFPIMGIKLARSKPIIYYIIFSMQIIPFNFLKSKISHKSNFLRSNGIFPTFLLFCKILLKKFKNISISVLIEILWNCVKLRNVCLPQRFPSHKVPMINWTFCIKADMAKFFAKFYYEISIQFWWPKSCRKELTQLPKNKRR